MMFIELTIADQKMLDPKLLVSVDKIVVMMQDYEGTRLWLASGETISVTETKEQIKAKIRWLMGKGNVFE